MVKLNLSQQAEEIKDIEIVLSGLPDLAIIELQVQQIKRLIFFSKRGLKVPFVKRTYNLATPVNNTSDNSYDGNISEEE